MTSTTSPRSAVRPDARPDERFRPDIQALRAVAVGAVVLYHWWPDQVRGGYVGVDVFFVISGFLITRHLADQLLERGRISLAQFWARRIRRLLPAAFGVLLASTSTLLVLMPTVTWKVNLQEIAAAAFYAENWLLAAHAVDYLAAHNSASLVQHYWSLSVEEQFYLGWPLLLLLAVGLGRRLRGTDVRRSLQVTLAVVAATSLAVSVVHTTTSPATAFFATWTRAWEFAAGGILALWPPLRLGTREAATRAVASWAGLATIGYSVFFITADAAFPGWIATVPVLGAALVIAGGTSSLTWSPTRLARLRVVQWLGDISYSLYLWHWPLIIAAPWILHASPGWPAKVALLALSIGLAFVTKRYVEDPIRTGARWRRTSRPAYAFAAAGMVVFLALSSLVSGRLTRSNAAQETAALEQILAGTPCFGAAAIVDRSCTDPFARPSDLDTAFAAADLDSRGDACQQNVGSTTVDLCAYGETATPTKTVAVVGNSHAVRLIPALDLYGREHGWKILLAAHTDCLGLTTKPVGDQQASNACLAWSESLHRSLLALPKLDAVVFATHVDAQLYLAGHRPSKAALSDAREQVLQTWTSFRHRGVPVIVAEDVPGMRPQSGPECIARSTTDDPCALSRAAVVKPNLVTELAEHHPELVTYLPMTPYFCDETTCHSLIGGVAVYSDSHHVTTTYSRSLGRYVGPKIADALR